MTETIFEVMNVLASLDNSFSTQYAADDTANEAMTAEQFIAEVKQQCEDIVNAEIRKALHTKRTRTNKQIRRLQEKRAKAKYAAEDAEIKAANYRKRNRIGLLALLFGGRKVSRSTEMRNREQAQLQDRKVQRYLWEADRITSEIQQLQEEFKYEEELVERKWYSKLPWK